MSKVLIIEDEEAIADLEKDYLELSGFDVVVENNGIILHSLIRSPSSLARTAVANPHCWRRSP